MAVLQPSEYDQSYFDGSKATYRHNAGYGKYERWYRKEGEGSLGEYWKDYANRWVNHLAIANKKVLEIGCAKGFLVKDLRDAGVDAYGIDVSQYAIDNCESEVAPYLTVVDARTGLTGYKRNEFDVLLSFRFMECIPEADIPDLIDEMNRISKLQVHVIDETSNQYYIEQPLEWWINFDWDKNTRLVANENLNKVLTK